MGFLPSMQRAGLILSDWMWRAQSITENSKHDFILLSRAQKSRNDDESVNLDEKRYEKREWWLLNVMLVKWTADGFAERIVVGNVHYNAWVVTNPITGNVQLS